jgi:hypothetical protein
MGNEERTIQRQTLAKLDTQETGQWQTIQKQKQKTQHRKLKRWVTQTLPKTDGGPRCSRRVHDYMVFDIITINEDKYKK